MTKNESFPLNLSLAAYVKKAEKIGKVMTRRVLTSRESKIHNRELKTRPLSVCEYLIVMFKVFYCSLLL